MAESVIYTLENPVVRKVRTAGSPTSIEETITELEIRDLNGGDLRWLQVTKGKVADQSLKLLGRLAGLDDKVIDLLSATDIAGISDVVADFLPESLKAGQGSSET